MARLTGRMVIGSERVAGTGTAIRAVDPRTGARLDPEYRYGGEAEVERACALAEEAFDAYRATPPERRAAFLETVAVKLDDLTDALVARATAETGLPEPRLTGEVARTTGQLRLFAADLRAAGDGTGPVDPAGDAGPEIRQGRVALGPVTVFGASNFPLAFSVAGGDTASALAAGCPVIVKAHDAHPGTCELVGRAVSGAVREAGLPEGVFSMLYGDGPTLGIALVTDPRVQAVGFTGSRAAGLAIAKAAANRPRPIPVYAEMSSVNPVFLLPEALAEGGGELADAFAGSVTLGAGQFCTSPGLVFAVRGPALDAFLDAAAKAIAGDPGAPMLTPGIARAYAEGVGRLERHPEVEILARGREPDAAVGGAAALAAVDAEHFGPGLQEEIFGACSLVVRCADLDQVRELARGLEGQLTVTIHAAAGDREAADRLLPVLERLAGRIVWDGWPTGVRVGHAMVHGGPFPATSDSRTTSVGSLAIERFRRPIAYQGARR
ncbi:aldehyde dehydrogenase (NADP(+)) [Actinomadura livida]|uniref:Aldehyde dehydrogenase (NADP(+)) n=1 Tax=Actinomadura livida TaxID=79909 RepID=A0A7W7MX92_9ACTN|nr:MULTISPECIES: aldehyde dehydrogenase (NADP(+)) [Actinomadura]MBB4773677.1 NADP-dependent aldehyde dehydrogenase [Actinomadura catellatispora]GGU09979.1 2,5-dioxovalerate dehydrogenase [Actinomadura livida]